MSYFRLWTLREGDADEHVPFAGQLRKANDTWQETLRTWLDGQVLCEEARRYVANVLSVHRVRHSDDDSEPENSDDLISDEDLILSSSALDEALDTRIGGRAPRQMLKTRTWATAITQTRKLPCDRPKKFGGAAVRTVDGSSLRSWSRKTCRRQ